MSLEEHTGYRDLTYSAWHRTLDPSLTYIDIDACEYCEECGEPLALIEIARDTGKWKAAWKTWLLAKRANLPAYCVLYTVGDDDEIESFRVRKMPETQHEKMTPEEYEDLLMDLRRQHQCPSGKPTYTEGTAQTSLRH
jgi:hypothetical protein